MGEHRQPQTDHGPHPRIGTRGSQANRGAKRKSGKDQWQVKFMLQPIQGGLNIVRFPVSMIVFPLAQSGAAEVETQNRKTKMVQRLHGMKDHLVVKRSTEERMRMAHQGGVCGVGSAGVE